ncbi:rRNA-processing protein UTP23, putative [Ricinus communis]|uniref:rRNA-processing protein UTP23, putative n=1 Tax=Ricinus communis TaxID=3988 RepID=B9SW27_RICCO|nr:rRNA-processing protein UTP23, putative [Ricinus communis]
MRVRKQKRHRRAVRFYVTCYGFRQPYKILCDGTFVHHLIVNRIAPADEALANILGGPVKLFTTRCVHAELKRLGKSYSESLQAAHLLMTARCDHEKVKSAEACILEVIGQNNPEHFFVATQDFDLRKKFREVPAVPLIFGLRNSLHLEPPSAFQHAFVKASEEERLHATELEQKMLKTTTKSILGHEGEIEGPKDQNLEMQPVEKKHSARNKTDVKDRPQFKRKRAKGPNPLSCKKKKKDGNPKPSLDKILLNINSNMGGFMQETNVSDNPVRSRGKKRKRLRKEKHLLR